MTNSPRRSALPRNLLALAFVGAFALADAPRASAQVTFGLDGGWYDMTNARNSAKAIFGGAAGGPLLGAQVRLPIGKSLFVAGHGRFMRRTGERVFVAEPGGEVFRLGHPLTVRIIPAFALVGYKFGGATSSFQPYAGIGAGVTNYNEESDIAGVKESNSTTKPSGHAALGFDWGRGGLRFGAELGYSLVPNAIGEGGVSAVYGEDDIGGVTAVLRVSFGH